MKYNKSVMIYSEATGGRVLRMFESNEEISNQKIYEILGVRPGVALTQVQIVDTPVPEVICPKVVVEIRARDTSMYLGISIDGKWGKFWRLPPDLTRNSLISLMVIVQKNGEINRDPDSDTWVFETAVKEVVAACDGKGMAFNISGMNEYALRRLDFKETCDVQ